ncbi:hypothetical protein EON68_01510 [archaeon]|nr:MAG: hypothetical protein EON68_01510 [archaeon]
MTVSSSDSADVSRSARTSVSSATSTYAPPPPAASRRGSGKEAEDTSRSSTSLKRFGSAIAVPMDVVPPTTVTALPTLSSAHGTFAPQAAPPTTSAPPSVAAPAAEHRPASAVLRAAAGSGLFMSKRTLSRMTFDDSNGALRATSAAGSRRPSYMAMNAEGDEGEDYLEEYHAPEAADEAALARIASLRRQIDAQSVSGYADEFDEIAAAEEIVVGLVPEEEIKRREQELELSRLLAEQDSGTRAHAYQRAYALQRSVPRLLCMRARAHTHAQTCTCSEAICVPRGCAGGKGGARA